MSKCCWKLAQTQKGIFSMSCYFSWCKPWGCIKCWGRFFGWGNSFGPLGCKLLGVFACCVVDAEWWFDYLIDWLWFDLIYIVWFNLICFAWLIDDNEEEEEEQYDEKEDNDDGGHFLNTFFTLDQSPLNPVRLWRGFGMASLVQRFIRGRRVSIGLVAVLWVWGDVFCQEQGELAWSWQHVRGSEQTSTPMFIFIKFITYNSTAFQKKHGENKTWHDFRAAFFLLMVYLL